MPGWRVGVLGAALVAMALTGRARAVDPGREAMDRARALEEGERKWTDRQQRIRLTIGGVGGDRVREVDLFERKLPGGDPHQKQLLVFRSPAEVKGTTFLSWQHRGRVAEQWLFLPELKRVRQIVARVRNESFVGTDLSYKDLDIVADLVTWTEADAVARQEGDEREDGITCHKIALTPQRDDIGYPRLVVLLGAADLVPRRIEFHEQDGLKKVLHQSRIEKVGAIPVARHITVETPAAGSRTTIEVERVVFDQGIEEDRFTQAALERGGD